MLFWSAIVQSCIVCCKIESHLPFVSTKHLDMKVSLLSKQRISAQPPETQETHKGPFLSPLLHQHPSCHTITLRFINYSNLTWAKASTDNSKSVFTDQIQSMAWDFWLGSQHRTFCTIYCTVLCIPAASFFISLYCTSNLSTSCFVSLLYYCPTASCIFSVSADGCFFISRSSDFPSKNITGYTKIHIYN